jgi:hypothetical protein
MGKIIIDTGLIKNERTKVIIEILVFLLIRAINDIHVNVADKKSGYILNE